MKKKSIIGLLITILLTSFIFSCSSDRTFKELKIKRINLTENRVMGFGTGKARSPEIAKIKAETNAVMNLLSQVYGMDFVYSKSNGAKIFTAKAKGKLTDVKEVASYNFTENTSLVIRSAPAIIKEIDFTKASLLGTSYRTVDLEKSLTEKYQIAIKEIVDKKYSDKMEIKGRLYLSEIKVSDYEDKDDFMVKLIILIII